MFYPACFPEFCSPITKPLYIVRHFTYLGLFMLITTKEHTTVYQTTCLACEGSYARNCSHYVNYILFIVDLGGVCHIVFIARAQVKSLSHKVPFSRSLSFARFHI